MPSLSAVDRVGARVLGLFEFVGALAAFGARAGVEAFRPPYEPREIARHVYQFGYALRAADSHGGLRDRRRAVDAHARLARALRRRGDDSGRASPSR